MEDQSPKFEVTYGDQAYAALFGAIQNALLFDAWPKAAFKLKSGADMADAAGEYSFATKHFGGDAKRLDEVKAKVELRAIKVIDPHPFARIAILDLSDTLAQSIVKTLKITITKQGVDSGDFQLSVGTVLIGDTHYQLAAKATAHLDTCKTDAKLYERRVNPPRLSGNTPLKPD